MRQHLEKSRVRSLNSARCANTGAALLALEQREVLSHWKVHFIDLCFVITRSQRVGRDFGLLLGRVEEHGGYIGSPPGTSFFIT